MTVPVKKSTAGTAAEAWLGQGGFNLAALDDVIHDAFDLAGDGTQEFRADFS